MPPPEDNDEFQSDKPGSLSLSGNPRRSSYRTIPVLGYYSDDEEEQSSRWLPFLDWYPLAWFHLLTYTLEICFGLFLSWNLFWVYLLNICKSYRALLILTSHFIVIPNLLGTLNNLSQDPPTYVIVLVAGLNSVVSRYIDCYLGFKACKHPTPHMKHLWLKFRCKRLPSLLHPPWWIWPDYPRS